MFHFFNHYINSMRSLLLFLFVMISFRIQAQEWNNYTPANSPIKNIDKIKDIAVDPVTQDVWFAAETMIYRRTSDGTWTSFQTGVTEGLSLAVSTCITARNGIVWTGQSATNESTDKFSYFNGTTWHTITNPFEYRYIGDIEVTEEFIWVACNAGLLQYDGQTWKKLNHEGKITAPTSISWNQTTRNLWVANNCAPTGNVFKYDLTTTNWTEYILSHKCAHAVQVIPNGSAYVGSCVASSVTSIRNEVVAPRIETSCVTIDGIVFNPLNEEEVWIGTDYNSKNPSGLLLYNGNLIVRSLNFKNSNMKGGSVENIAVQKIDNNTAMVWMKTLQYDPKYPTGVFLETYTYSAPDNSLKSFQFTEPLMIANIKGNEVTAWAPLNTDLTALKAVFTASEGAIVKVGDVIQESGVTANDFRSPITYTIVSLGGETKNYRVSVTIAGNSFLSFQFQEPSVIANIENNQITAVVPPHTDLSHLIADFTTSPEATVTVNDINQKSGITINDFRAPVMYSVTSAYGEVRNYQASISVITGITEKHKGLEVQIFPMPVKDHFVVKFGNNFRGKTPLKLSLHSVLGEVIESREVHQEQKEIIFDATALGSEMLMLKVNSNFYKIIISK
jgi:hypothetical protein